MRKRLLALFCCAALAAPLPAAAAETPVNLARGKSYTVGWDSNWGLLTPVTSSGSPRRWEMAKALDLPGIPMRSR